MDSSVQFMPRPFDLAVHLARPLLVVVGGFALFLAVLHLVVGEDPSGHVGGFLIGSVDALGPYAAFLIVLWLYYFSVYLVAGACVDDLRTIAQAPDWLVGFLRQHLLAFRQASTLLVQFVPSLFPVHLYQLHPPGLQVAGWRAGDSAQLE